MGNRDLRVVDCIDMSLEVRLLGVPSIERDGAPVRLSGRKTWALLAMLILEGRPLGRQELIDRLTSEADDPQSAFRWLLHTVRRALAPEAMVIENDGRLHLACTPAVVIDVNRLLEYPEAAGVVDEIAAGGLLEGIEVDDSATLSFWLSMERTRLSGVTAEALWWAATSVATTDPDRAMRLVRRGLRIDPYCETKHELLIDLFLQQGDVSGAHAHAAAVDRLYREEFGVEAPSSIRRPIERRRTDSIVAPGPSARALLDAAQARSASGHPGMAIETARRAADAALEAGDPELELASLSLLSRILIHAQRGREAEAKGLLSRAAQLASNLGDAAALADVEREFGYVLVLEGNHGAADPLLTRSMNHASRVGDTDRFAQAALYRGIGLSDRCDYAAAAATFVDCIAAFGSIHETSWQGYAEGMFARMLLQSGDVSAARGLARAATARVRSANWVAVLPWPLLVEAECALVDGNVSAAADGFGVAITLSMEIGDATCEGLALRGLGLTRARADDRPGAIGLLEAGLTAARRFEPGYARAIAVILADLVDLEEGRNPDHLEDGYRLAMDGSMRDLADRLRRWHVRLVRQTLTQTVPA